MKKTVSVLLLFLILLTIPVSAASGKLTANDVSGKVGDKVTVTVHLDNPGIIATRISVSYDDAVLRLNGAENGAIFDGQHALFGKDTNENPYILLWEDSLRTSNITTSGTLCTLQFTVLKNANGGSTVVRFTVDAGSTFDTNLQNVHVSDGSCTIRTGSASSSGSAKPATDTTKPSTTAAQKASTSANAAKTTKPITAATKAADTSVASSKPASGTTSASAVSNSSAVSQASDVSQASAASSAAAGSTIAGQTEANGTAAAQTAADPAQTDPESAALSDPETAETGKPSDDGAAAESAEEAVTTGTRDRRVNLLWLLVLVPVAAVLLFVLFKKKK